MIGAMALLACDGSREQRQIDALNLRLDSLENKTKPLVDTIDKKIEQVGEKATEAAEKIDSTIKKKIH
jgi:hypothetical protein